MMQRYNTMLYEYKMIEICNNICVERKLITYLPFGGDRDVR